MKYISTIIILLALIGIEPEMLESTPSYAIYQGEASWYAEFSPGIRETTANMEIFDHDKMTCAMWEVPFNTMVEVRNLKNNKKVIVRVNDRGPAKRYFKKGRIIDLTKAAFEEIANLDIGLTKVQIRILR